MIYEGRPINEIVPRLTTIEAIRLDETESDRESYEIQALTSLFRTGRDVIRWKFKYQCFPYSSAQVQLLDQLNQPDSFWDMGIKFSELGLKLSAVIRGSKRLPQIWHSHVSQTDLDKIHPLLRGNYEPIRISAPGLGLETVPVLNDPLDIDGLTRVQRKHAEYLYKSDMWRTKRDPWHNY